MPPREGEPRDRATASVRVSDSDPTALSGLQVFHTESGSGYGSYPIFSLQQAGRSVGAEVECISRPRRFQALPRRPARNQRQFQPQFLLSPPSSRRP